MTDPTIAILIGISGLFVGFIAGVLAASIGDDERTDMTSDKFWEGQ